MPPLTEVSHLLPLKPVDFHILLVLTDGDLHGYGIVKEIETRTDGGIRLEPGNLYRYVQRLVDAGMVQPTERRSVDGSDETEGADRSSERRRYYCVTSLGREVLKADAIRMRSLVAAAASRVPLGDPLG